MTDPFAKPVVPRAHNSSGLPKPPSGSHPADPKPTVIFQSKGKPPAGGAK
jgi:hypothetical protein